MSRNREMIEIIANGLKHKLKESVFVGGSVIELYCNKVAISEPRATVDVDIVVEITTRSAYDIFEGQLRELGFKNDISGPACRMIYKDVKLDVITTVQSGSGFTNKWYELGFKSSVEKTVDQYTINIFPVEYFIASKFEAYKGRGKDDLYGSHDLEDIFYVIDGKEDIMDDINNSEPEVKEYLRDEINKLLKNPQIREIVSAHLGFSSATERIDRIIDIFSGIK